MSLPSSAIRMFSVLGRPSGDVYRALVRHAASVCPYAHLVVTESLGITSELEYALRELAPHLIEERKTDHWPGTQLGEASADFYLFATSDLFAATLLRLSHSLYDWQQPQLPEDLGFWRDRDTPWLGSIAHEEDAFLNLTPDEALALSTKIIGLELSEDGTPHN
jgi:hypothetical protein